MTQQTRQQNPLRPQGRKGFTLRGTTLFGRQPITDGRQPASAQACYPLSSANGQTRVNLLHRSRTFCFRPTNSQATFGGWLLREACNR